MPTILRHINDNLELRGSTEGRTVEGYAIRFNEPSLPFTDTPTRYIDEVIAPEAVTLELLNRSDIVMNYNHDMDRVLARSVNGKGTLTYSVDEHGVRFKFEAPDTPDGNTVLELVRRGDLRGCSFAFSLDGDSTVEEATETRDGRRCTRYTVRRVAGIHDFAVVVHPRYPDTEVQSRNINNTNTNNMPQLTTEQQQSLDAARNRVAEVTNSCATENRDMTADEAAELRSLNNRIAVLEARAASDTAAAVDIDTQVRSNVQRGEQTRFTFARALNTTTTAQNAVPLNIGDVVHPLEEGLIIGQLGLPVMTGLSGDYIWPSYEAAEATVAGEGVALADSTLNWSKIQMRRERIGIAYPVTRESINATAGVTEQIVRRVIPEALVKLLNKQLLSTTAGAAGTISGPFVGAARQTFAAAVPTLRELAKMKAAVLGAGVDGTNMCWVMTRAMAAELESTPRAAGDGRMILEDDKILGYPVFYSHYIGDGNIGLGDWHYQPLGLFGDINFTVDPYSLSRKNAVDFVLNAEYGTCTLKQSAFVLGVAKA